MSVAGGASSGARTTPAAGTGGSGTKQPIGFDDLGGLQTYLGHSAHAELAARFYQSLSSALVFDFEEGGVEGIALEAPHAV